MNEGSVIGRDPNDARTPTPLPRSSPAFERLVDLASKLRDVSPRIVRQMLQDVSTAWHRKRHSQQRLETLGRCRVEVEINLLGSSSRSGFHQTTLVTLQGIATRPFDSNSTPDCPGRHWAFDAAVPDLGPTEV